METEKKSIEFILERFDKEIESICFKHIFDEKEREGEREREERELEREEIERERERGNERDGERKRYFPSVYQRFSKSFQHISHSPFKHDDKHYKFLSANEISS